MDLRIESLGLDSMDMESVGGRGAVVCSHVGMNEGK